MDLCAGPGQAGDEEVLYIIGASSLYSSRRGEPRGSSARRARRSNKFGSIAVDVKVSLFGGWGVASE
jgi:hypothetical protein